MPLTYPPQTAATWKAVSSNYTAVAGEKILADSTAGNITITLPATSLGAGAQVEIAKIGTTNKVFVAVGNKFAGTTLGTDFLSLEVASSSSSIYVWVDATIGWIDTSANGIINKSYPVLLLEATPSIYARLNDATGTGAVDSSGNGLNFTLTASLNSVAGLYANSGTAKTWAGSVLGQQTASVPTPLNFTLEASFRSSASAAQGIIGFSNVQGAGGSSFDKSLHLNSAGKVVFAVFTGSNVELVSPLSYNDNQPHTVTVMIGPAIGGTQLWVDGVLVASNTNTTTQNYTGFWHLGYTANSGYFNGTLDEVSVLNNASSTAAQIQRRHAALRG